MIKVKMTGVKELTAFIKSLPRGMKVEGMRAASEYFIGNESRGLQHYPPKPAGSKYVRTFHLQKSWYVGPEGSSDWGRFVIGNTAEYAKWVVGNDTQAWMHVGRWRTVAKNIADNMAGAIRSAQAAVNALLARRGK